MLSDASGGGSLGRFIDKVNGVLLPDLRGGLKWPYSGLFFSLGQQSKGGGGGGGPWRWGG